MARGSSGIEEALGDVLGLTVAVRQGSGEVGNIVFRDGEGTALGSGADGVDGGDEEEARMVGAGGGESGEVDDAEKVGVEGGERLAEVDHPSVVDDEVAEVAEIFIIDVEETKVRLRKIGS